MEMSAPLGPPSMIVAFLEAGSVRMANHEKIVFP